MVPDGIVQSVKRFVSKKFTPSFEGISVDHPNPPTNSTIREFHLKLTLARRYLVTPPRDKHILLSFGNIFGGNRRLVIPWGKEFTLIHFSSHSHSPGVSLPQSIRTALDKKVLGIRPNGG